MLVLSRQRDESIMIGDDVEITIVDVRGDKVRLGITAPKSIPVHRREIYDAIQREKAAGTADAEKHFATHGINVGHGVGGCNRAEVIRIIDDRWKEICSCDNGLPIVQTIYGRIVSIVQPDKQVWVIFGRKNLT